MRKGKNCAAAFGLFVVILIFLSACHQKASEAAAYYNGIKRFSYAETEDGITITDFDTTDAVFSRIYIPPRIGDKKVVAVGSEMGIFPFNDVTYPCVICIPDSVKTINEYAFFNCTGVTSIIQGKNVNKIGAYAFGNCENLQEVSFLFEAAEVDQSAFTGCPYFASISESETIEPEAG